MHSLAGGSIVGVRMVPEPDFACFQRYTRTLLDACNRLVQQLWGFVAGLVCIQSPVVELRMSVVMAWLWGQQGRIGPGRGAG